MKKSIVFMLVAVSLSMANIDLIPFENNVECTYTDRSSFKLIKNIPGPEEVLLACQTNRGYVSRYEVAFDSKLTYIAVAVDLIPSFGVYREVLTMYNGVYLFYHDDGEDGDYYLDGDTVKVKSSRGKSSPKEIRRAYEAILSHFTIKCQIGEPCELP